MNCSRNLSGQPVDLCTTNALFVERLKVFKCFTVGTICFYLYCDFAITLNTVLAFVT